MIFSANLKKAFNAKVATAILLFTALEAGAISADRVEPQLKSDMASAMQILAGQESITNKANSLFALFDGYFDYELMAKLSLGGLFKGLDGGEFMQFRAAFEDNLKHSFTEKLSYYTDQQIEISGATRPNEKRIFVKAALKSGADSLEIVFKFHKKSADDFYIYDVDILGISVIQTYRAQFEGLGEGAQFGDILGRLKAVKFD